jgi:hypothetical protein
MSSFSLPRSKSYLCEVLKDLSQKDVLTKVRSDPSRGGRISLWMESPSQGSGEGGRGRGRGAGLSNPRAAAGVAAVEVAELRREMVALASPSKSPALKKSKGGDGVSTSQALEIEEDPL